MGSVICLLSGCAKKELERMTDSTEEKKEELLMEYKFTQNGISTVDIGESKEMILAFRHFNNAINSKTQSNFSKQLESYRNVIAGALSPTDEALRKPVADRISGLADQLYALVGSEAASRKAQPGVSGTVAVSNEESRMLDEKGVELGQVIQKALMGALTLDKVNYFLEKALKADNASPVAGKNYTEMAHCWDIAYGYLGTLDVDPNRLAPLFLANYIEKEAVGMQGLSGINTSVYQAFTRDGRPLETTIWRKCGSRWFLFVDRCSSCFPCVRYIICGKARHFWNGRSRCRAKVTSIPWERHLGLSWPFRL